MPISIGSNISSLQAQRLLSATTQNLAATYERLASGQRINRASDDAAGLAIADTLNVSTRVATQALRNLNDGIGVVSIADSAAAELTGILIRHKELAEQSANGVYSDTQRQALNTESQALMAEYNRVLSVTKFNGISVFDKLAEGLHLQGGVGTEAVLTLALGVAGTGGGDTGGLEISEITRFSTDSSGAQATGGGSSSVGISDNARYIVFHSTATNMVAGDNNGQQDIFLKDTLTGIVTRLSTDSSGTQASGGESSWPQITENGRHVVFSSGATNLVAGDNNARYDIFLKDTISGTTTRISTDSSGTQATGGHSFEPQITPDGRFVVFRSAATNLVAGDTNAQYDIFLKDTLNGTTTRISTDSSGTQAAGFASFAPQISENGRYVVFYSSATNLVAGDNNGFGDVFLKDTTTGTTTRLSTDSSGSQGVGGNSGVPQITPDGRYVVFYSNATNLVAGDTNGNTDVFLKDTLTGATTRLSTDSSGAQASGGNSVGPQITPDGRYVVFCEEPAKSKSK